MWRWAEATLTAAGGSAIAYGTGLVVGGAIDAAWLPAAAALAGAGNGGFAGARRIYAWSTVRGWTAFVLDSSWALIGAVQGLISNTASTVSRRGDFSPELSERRNRHVFGAGFALRPAFATTHGNVISNARLGRPEPIADRVRLVENHEDLHVWQQRWFGPLFPLTYVVFGIVGVAIGTVFGLLSRERRRRGIRIGKLVETAAYYDNPFEVWAYAADGRWETCAAEPVLKWGRFRWEPADDD